MKKRRNPFRRWRLHFSDGSNREFVFQSRQEAENYSFRFTDTYGSQPHLTRIEGPL